MMALAFVGAMGKCGLIRPSLGTISDRRGEGRSTTIPRVRGLCGNETGGGSELRSMVDSGHIKAGDITGP